MAVEYGVITIKYILIGHKQIRKMRFEIKNKFTILILYLKLFLILREYLINQLNDLRTSFKLLNRLTLFDKII